jgi:allantoin racemase
MRILVIDPVTSKGLQGDKAYLQSVADAETEVEVVGLERGPKSIETFYDATYAGPEILRLVRERGKGVEAIMINCFADPALDAAREITDRPVLGPAETSMSVALHLGSRFSVISVLANTAPWVRLQAIKLGVERRLASALGVDIPVLELESQGERTVDEIVKAAREAIERDEAEVIILGCTGMATLADKVRERLSVPVVEPAATTLKMAELMVKLGLRHHRGGVYLLPSFDKIVGH